MRFHHWSLPRWILRHRRRDYWAARYLGRPRDPQDAQAVREIYKAARLLRRSGVNVVVDHIEPLCSDWVCGLSHAANLRIVYHRVNAAKSNAGDHQHELWPLERFVPEQMRLIA